MNMRLACSAGLAALVMASLEGCSTHDGAASDTIGQTSAPLTGTFTLTNYVTGLCLSVQSGGYAVAKTCNNGTDENWQASAVKSDGTIDLISTVTPVPYRCLDKAGYFQCSGTWCYYEGDGPCSASSGWHLYFVGKLGTNDCYHFEDGIVPNLVLSPLNLSHSNGTRADVMPNTGAMEQVWCVPQAAGGY